MFDAYNIKKVLPRLVVAVILIQLSWFIFTALIRLTAVVAYGLEGLMYAPFGGRDQIAFSEILSNSNVNGGSGLFLAAVGVAGFAALYLGVAFSLALTALIGLFVGFLTLLIRQVVLITLLVLSPLALVAWILPGTQKFWKIWWESFSKLLLMFPMIVVLVAAGRIVAFISAQISGVDTNNLYGSTQIDDIAFLAIITIGYFGPFFLIPKTFQLAGSAFGNITGMVNDRSRGVFDRLKKGRQAKAGENIQKTRAGSRFNERGQFGKYNPVGRINRVAQGAMLGTRGGFGLGKRGRSAMDLSSRAAGTEAMKNPLLQQLQFNDDGILALGLSAGSSAQAKKRLQKLGWDENRINTAVSAAASVGFNKQNSLAALELTARNKSFSLPGGAEGMETVVDAANSLSNGNKTMSDNILGGFEYHSRNAGRLDLGYHNYTTGKANLSGAWNKAALGQHAQGTGESLQAFADYHLDRLEHGTGDERRKAAIAMVEMQNMLPMSTGANQEIINDTMNKLRNEVGQRVGVDFNTGVPVEDQLARIASSGPAGTAATDLNGQPLTGSAIRGMARVYDQSTPYAARGDGLPPPQPPPGADQH
ncbi:hypothetical protein KC963_01375 [Candidatus Saccharibacteria bacterium]|nr:hypothetical protein [Candidatus Saccharibacteria bacterium]